MKTSREAHCLRVLLVETDEKNAGRLRGLLSKMPVRVEVDWARSFEAGIVRMTSSRYDAHLVAARIGDRSGLDILRAYRESEGDAPVLLLSDAGDRALDLAAMENGAAGFVVSDLLDAELLERSIRYAVEARRQEAALRSAREELRERVEERSTSLETINTALAMEVAERRRAEQRLRDVDRRKNEFLATLAHELRNPLAPIGHATEILARLGDGEEDRARAAEARKVIERQVIHLVRLIDDLLDISRISHGRIGLRPELVTLASVVESALEAARPLFLGRQHTLEVIVPDDSHRLLRRSGPARADPHEPPLERGAVHRARRHDPRGGDPGERDRRPSGRRLRNRNRAGCPGGHLHDVLPGPRGARSRPGGARHRTGAREAARRAARRLPDRGQRRPGEGKHVHASPSRRDALHGASGASASRPRPARHAAPDPRGRRQRRCRCDPRRAARSRRARGARGSRRTVGGGVGPAALSRRRHSRHRTPRVQRARGRAAAPRGAVPVRASSSWPCPAGCSRRTSCAPGRPASTTTSPSRSTSVPW